MNIGALETAGAHGNKPAEITNNKRQILNKFQITISKQSWVN